MSTVDNSTKQWSKFKEPLDEAKYEKCRNITEEIYKRINITFQIKKLETERQSEGSDLSDLIDSNELSNETDLFACDKSDSLTSTDVEKPQAACEKYININNNEEPKKSNTVVYKRPKKRFRKRVKKRQSRFTRHDSDGSSDEALPLSRMVELDTVKADHPESSDNVMGVPNIVIIAREIKPKMHSPIQRKQPRKETMDTTVKPEILAKVSIEKAIDKDKSLSVEKTGSAAWKNCTMCTLTFRGERGLRRHMTMSHILTPTATKLT